MKNFMLITLALFFSGIHFMSGQDLRFGAKAGLNLAGLNGNQELSYDAKPGFHLGAVVEIPVSDVFSVQPEALISLQGARGFFQDDLNFWYLNFPVMLKYNIWDALSLEAGPQIGFLLSDNLEGNSFGGGGGPITFAESNTLDFGFGAGAGYALDENFYFQLRFNAGIINSIKDNDSKNWVLQLSAVYFF